MALAVHFKDVSKNGTMIALKNNECLVGEGDVLRSSNGLVEGGESAVSVVASPNRAGLLELQVFYSDLVLNQTSALVMLEQLDDLLAFILANPAKPIASSLAAVRPSLLSTSNEIQEELAQDVSQAPHLQAQFEKFACHSPHRVALDFRKNIDAGKSSDNIAWTYEQLNDRAEAFATYLVHRFGDLTDHVIPICMGRCPELYVAILGILKTGGAWCPIDASFPAHRRHNLIARTGARVLIVAEHEPERSIGGIPEGIDTVDVSCLEDIVTNRVTTRRANMGSLAYLIWTSGTTGDPKGVPIHHEAAVISMRALQRSIPVDVTGGIVRCLQFSQFTFDVFVQDLFYTWGVGGTVISSTQEIILGSFTELATKTEATHAHLTPAFAASVPRARCPTLEVITMIGEKLPQVIADDWSRNMRAFNTYGPAETAVVSTFRQFGAAGEDIRSENIGFPLPSVSAFVMYHGHPVMRNGIGELALGGPQLSKGYWNDPERSSGSFVWNEQYSRHLYMTGDLVRQVHDGSLEFVGRTDDLIKVQGIRIELSEIGFSLSPCHPLIEQVEIQYLDRYDRPSKVIVAFLAAPKLEETKNLPGQLIVTKKSIPVAQSALLEAQRTLPSYMIPSVFLVVNSIPRTSSAKIDKTVLKKVYSSIDLGTWERMLASNDNNISEVVTWSTRELDLVTIVAEFSGTSRDSMSRASELRSIGIDSIAATTLAPLLNSRGFLLSVADILLCQNLDDLAKMCTNSRTTRRAETYDLDAFHDEWYPRVKEKLNRNNFFVVPALPLQESLLSESMRNVSAYWSHTCLSLDAQVDDAGLYEAWSHVVHETESLRTGFIPSAAVRDDRDDGSVPSSTFMQLIYDEVAIVWTCVRSSESGLIDLATQRARAVAENHQRNHFMDPPLAVTIFEQPSSRVMMISVHHSVRDEASLDLILADLCKSYQRVCEGSQQRHQLREALQVILPTKAQIAQDENFWSKALHGFATTDDANTWPDLTGKSRRNEEPAAASMTRTRALKTSYKDLQLAAFSLGASSTASILRVAWGLVLLEYLETESVVFAETWSNRTDDVSLIDVIGPLMAVVPVLFRALGSTREALVAQSSFQEGSRAHRSVHPRVIRKLLSRSESQILYPAVFNFLPGLREDSRNGCSSMWDKLDNIVDLTVEHPLALNVTQAANDVLEMEIAASQDVMSSTQLALLALQVDAFVETMLLFPDIPLTQLSMHFAKNLLSITSVSFSEEVRLAWKQNPTNWVDYYALVHPNWPAAEMVTSLLDECESRSWSFVELRSAYRRVAAFITHNNCSNRMIAMCLDRRIEAYAVILGILASGNTYLPIDEDLPGERKSFLMQDSGAAMLFTTRSLALTFPSTPFESRVVYVDDITYEEQIAHGHSTETPPNPQASDNAYLLYTSGSTGVPKGVLVGRGNLCSFIEGLCEFIRPLIPRMNELPGQGKYLGLASRAFDVHIAEMFLAWRQGLAAVTCSRTMLLDNLELALRKLRITHASFVPSLIDQAGLDSTSLPDLHYLGVGGEKMSKRVVDTWASNENAALVNAYGPTEMSIGCTAAEVTRESNLRNIGRPYGNTVAHVLVSGSDRYTLRGVAGELCFTGDLVANGYHNRPDAKGFIRDFNGVRMYRTGDIVRLMADDTLEYLRREDDQTKVRGQRLELGEITEAIRSIAVTTLGFNELDAATMVAQHPKLSRTQLVSFIVPFQRTSKAPGNPEILSSDNDYTITSKIQAGCRDVLPAYMVPDMVITLTKLPLAPSSGKADSKCLKALFASIPITDMVKYTSSEQSDHSESSSRQLTEAEKNVRSAITSTLAGELAEVSPTTNIFRLGLDSLSAISLAIKMQNLGYDCTVSNILRSPSLEQLALLPRKDRNREAPADKSTQTRSTLRDLELRFRATRSDSFRDSSIQAVKPCLSLQETLVATSLSNKSGALYVNHVRLRLSPNINYAQLHRAWTKVAADHSILRTCFQEFENGIVQIVLENDEPQSVSWEETTTSDPESASQLQQSKSTAAIISEIASRPPMRLTLFRPHSDDKSPILLISIHHALYDRESIAMVLQELGKRYDSVVSMAHTSFDLMIEHVYSQDQEASKVFWKEYLAHHRPTSIIDRTATADENPGNANFPTLDRTFASPLAEIESFSSSISGTLTSTMQAVFGIVLAQMLKVHDVIYGAVLSGRTVPIENPHTIVAPCITTVPQRVNLCTQSSSIVDIVKDAQKGFVESLEFQHTALRLIHHWVGAERPLFDCLVSCIRKLEANPSAGSSLWTELEDSMPNDFPFSVEFEADYEVGQMRAHCTFSPAFGDMNRAASFLENLDLLLGALIRQENVTTEDLEIAKGDAVDSISKSQIWDESHWRPKELQMQRIAAEMCGISAKDISKGASFFSLGIDSITAIRFAQRLRDSGIGCSSADVMRYPCIAALAEKTDALPQINNIVKLAEPPHESNFKQFLSRIPLLTPEDTVINIYACTPPQSSMLTQTLGSGGKLYFHHHVVRLACHINLYKLENAWQSLIRRTEILRTTFHFSDALNSWLGAVHQESPKVWAECHSQVSLPDSLAGITQHSGFCEEKDFERPPWKTTALRMAAETVLVISMHHSLYDGESIHFLFKDLASLYEGIDLQPRVSFSDVAGALSKIDEDAQQFWSRKLEGFESNDIFDSQRATETDMIALEITLDMTVQRTLRGCQNLGVTIQTVALLAYGKSLACILGRRDVVFGHVVGGRSLPMPGADEIIGPLLNTIPSRIVFDKTYVTNKMAALEIQRSSGDAQPHQHASLSRTQQEWRHNIGDANAQLLDTLFVFHNTVNRENPTCGLGTFFDTREVIAPTEYSTNFEIEQREEETILRVASRKSLMTRERLQKWLAEFGQVFRDILENPQRSVMAFPVSLQSLPLTIKSDQSRPPPRDEIEPGPDLETIITALSEVSRIPPRHVSANAGIFSLGLDSISAIQVAAICRKRGYGVSVADVLQGRSSNGICRRLRERSPEPESNAENQSTLISARVRSTAQALANVKDEYVEAILPCLAGQLYHLASWLKSRRTTSEAVWTYECSKRLNVDELRSAWRGLRQRHPVLRTVFVAPSPKEAVQVVLKPSAISHESFRCIEVPGDSKDRVIDHIKQEASEPFDLFNPPSKLFLVREDTQDFVLLKLHHATYDAWTIRTIVDDLDSLYHGVHLPFPPRFESSIHHTMLSLHTEAEKAYWRKSLLKCQRTLLEPPVTKSDIAVLTSSNHPPLFVSIKPAIANLQSLETTCRQSSISLPTIILLAFARALGRRNRITNPTFGIYQAGRSASFKGIDQLCAPCLNITPIVIPEALDRSASESARRLQADLAERVEFEQSYLHEVLDWVGCGGTPLFNTYVNILSQDGPRSPSSSSSSPPPPSSNPLFTHYQPETSLTQPITPPSPREPVKTAVDRLNTDYLAEQNLYLDVARSVADDCLEFGIKCDRELMDEEGMRAFAGAIMREVEWIMEAIVNEGDGGGEESKHAM